MDTATDGSPGVNGAKTQSNKGNKSLQSRAYQVEMFEQAMQENVIVAMETGSGKTQIAKRVWFCAPSVVLAQQQHAFLASQLPSHQIRLITGLDNVQFWSTKSIWDAVLDRIDVVVSTPQVLLDALSHGFFPMRSLSLLILDEAHHCLANHPMALIMHRFYRPLLGHDGTQGVPHVLGLTASPITNKASLLDELEQNVCAVCITPTIQIEDYKQYTHIPAIERVTYTPSSLTSSASLRALRIVAEGLSIHGDPTVEWLESRAVTNVLARDKLQKILTARRTPVMKQVHSFLGHAEHIHENMGAWAADLYVRTCALRLHEAVVRHESLVPSLADRELQYLDSKLQPVLTMAPAVQNETTIGHLIASKTQSVIKYMCEQYRPGITVIVFVKRRSAAFALTKLLQIHPDMQEFNVFSFVGSASPANRSLGDLADMQLQSEAFADFQAGKRNVCVATQVMEEGVDVQATNLVIRFDEPENFRSFVQSRGRARRPDSKFVMVSAVGESGTTEKLSKWRELETAMKEQYSDLSRTVQERTEFEEQKEDGDEIYHVSSTGALLTYDNAVQHLEHFCATLVPDEYGDPARPVIVITGKPLGLKSAQVILPSSISGPLQVTNSLRKWKTERMVRKDAAFQTYKRLHTAKLVNDHLLPWPREKTRMDKLENRDSKYEVRGALRPWEYILKKYSGSSYTAHHRVKVSGHGFTMPDMMILLPVQLDHDMQFDLYSNSSDSISVSITAEGHKETVVPTASRHQVTSYLFKTILGRRLKQIDTNKQLPYLVVPAVAMSDPSTWLDQVRSMTPLSEMVLNNSLTHRSYLLQHNREEILYRWRPSTTNEEDIKQYLPDQFITAERLSKQLSYLQNTTSGEGHEAESVVPDIRNLRVSDCSVSSLPEPYADFMLLLPSISYMLEIALRGQMAMQGPLSPILYSDSNLVAKALTSSSALSKYNYESLEFVGDALLKYYAATQVFFEHPTLTEGGLSNRYAKIVNNARLQRATKDLGLDAYITVEHFSGYKWTLAVNEGETKRQMSSKTLADAIEALIGAAFLDAGNHTSEEVVLSALTHILPEVKWKLPGAHVEDFHRLSPPPRTNIARLEDVEAMLGYKFNSKALLLEALTQSSTRIGVSSFERLEFLGDAILERLVVVALSQQCDGDLVLDLNLEPRTFKYRRDALCNRWFLAFLAMELQHTVTRNDIETDTASGQTTVVPVTKTLRLIDHIRTTSAGPNKDRQRQRAEASYLAARPTILDALDSGTRFPWVALHSIDTPKSYSDVIEATLGAVFIDSHGSLTVCARVLESLGVFKLVRRFATESDLELVTPFAKLTLTYPDVEVEVKRTTSKQTTGMDTNTNTATNTSVRMDDLQTHVCQISLDGKVLARAESVVSRKHAEACAAETALDVLEAKEGGG